MCIFVYVCVCTSDDCMRFFAFEFGSLCLLSFFFFIFPVLIPEAPTTTKDNSRIALGVGLGVSLPLACIAILIIIGVIGALIYEKKSAKRYGIYSWKINRNQFGGWFAAAKVKFSYSHMYRRVLT